MWSFTWINRGAARLFGPKDRHRDAFAQRPDVIPTIPPNGLEASDTAASPIEPAPRMPVDARGLALGILATLAILFALEWAQRFVVPVLLGVLLAYTLNPLVVGLEKLRVGRSAGAVIVMLAVVGVFVSGSYPLRDQIDRVVGQLPEATRTFSSVLDNLRSGTFGNLQKMKAAAGAIEKAANQATDLSSPQRQPVTHVVLDQPAFKLSAFLWVGSMGALGLIAQAMTVILLAFFLLVSGGTFKRKLVRLAGPSLSSKKITVRILDDINDSIQKYMLMLLVTNMLVGGLTWVAFRAIGLDNAGAWALAVGLLHVVPYLGPGVSAAATGMAAYMQFQSFSMALLVSGTSLAIAALVGTFVSTWITGKIAKMNPAAIFVSLLFWGWLWGIAGMLLSIPIIVIAKVVSQHVENFQPLAELLGE
ncbi:AI-2E family transporter [Pandoraea anapnoica]|uniref:AI-2E family transporter n=1 Tax=Pandoraea anapnoica TaxID=2508301 RepID=A0A5E4ZYP6_9BURK|nr:AI-2E family transporter [Pandoraea anapnoica]VVE65353.1 AI-2E family transporter [Pandoraea anapnoica]